MHKILYVDCLYVNEYIIENRNEIPKARWFSWFHGFVLGSIGCLLCCVLFYFVVVGMVVAVLVTKATTLAPNKYVFRTRNISCLKISVETNPQRDMLIGDASSQPAAVQASWKYFVNGRWMNKFLSGEKKASMSIWSKRFDKKWTKTRVGCHKLINLMVFEW